jgi:hypothetical protein
MVFEITTTGGIFCGTKLVTGKGWVDSKKSQGQSLLLKYYIDSLSYLFCPFIDAFKII